MLCPACRQENQPGQTHCKQCGTALGMQCGDCGSVNRPGARFCNDCGKALLSATVATPVQAPARPFSPAPEAPQPASFVGGRYEVKSLLGEGGKKKVYLVHDTALDRDVAFALLKAERLDEVSRSRVVREARAMARLSDHPNIMPIYDMGADAGRLYMVMPLMQGGDVETLLRSTSGSRLPIGQTLDIAKAVCEGLQFAHSRNIVHRDIKPGNVWLGTVPSTGAEAGTAPGLSQGPALGPGQVAAKIGDFGLALMQDESRVTQEGMMLGTVYYMAPEQAMGSEVAAQSDLYSLGAMLYEMVAGRPPFLGDDPVAIVGQHINTPPVAPTWHNPQCPKQFEALILRLLAKDPLQRPATAGDVLTALESIDAATVEMDAVGRQYLGLEALAAGVFVGRRQEMDQLKAALEEALSGRGRMMMLMGETGVGKTRTAQELVTYAGLRNAQTLWGRSYEEQGVPPYWPWVQAIRSYVRQREPEKLHSEMGSGLSDIARIVPDIRERLTVVPSGNGGTDIPRFRLFDSITTFLKNASQNQAMVLVMEDLHWADEASLLLLRFVARELERSRLLVVGTYRDMDLSRNHPLAETLVELARERLFQRVQLKGLGRDDVGRFIQMTTGIVPPSGLVSAVYAETEGNPLFVTEVVRLLVQEKELTPEVAAKRDSWTVRIPESVREVIGRRLNRLSERCNRALTLGSVLGREFDIHQMHRLMQDPAISPEPGLSEERLLEVLEEALAARVVEELPHAVGRYQFTHSLIQEALMRRLSLTRRVRLHARIGELLEELYRDSTETHAAELVHHFGQAESVIGSGKLVQYSIMAGNKALAVYAFEDALRMFQRALAAKQNAPMDVETAALYEGVGRAQGALFHWKDGLANLTRAFDYYAQSGNVHRALAVAEYPTADDLERGLTGASHLVARALELVPRDSEQAGRLLSRYGAFLVIDEGDNEGASQAFEQALGVARRTGDRDGEMRALGYSGYVDHFYLRYGEALEKLEPAIELARSLGDQRNESFFHYHAAFDSWALGEMHRFKQHAQASLIEARKLRDPQRQTSALACNVNRTLVEGEWAAAREMNERALAMAPEDPLNLWLSIWLESQVGQPDAARKHLDTLLQAMYTTTSKLGAMFVACTVPAVARAMDVRDLMPVAKKAGRQLLDDPTSNPLYLAMARDALGLVAAWEGDVEAAREMYEGLKGTDRWYTLMPATLTKHQLALLCMTMGRPDEALGHFEAAAQFGRKTGQRPALAWALCDYADALMKRASALRLGPGQAKPGQAADDRKRAAALLEECQAIARELKMPPLEDRTHLLRAALRSHA